MSYHSKIIGLGHYVPDHIVTNHDLSKKIDTNDAWIENALELKNVDMW